MRPVVWAALAALAAAAGWRDADLSDAGGVTPFGGAASPTNREDDDILAFDDDDILNHDCGHGWAENLTSEYYSRSVFNFYGLSYVDQPQSVVASPEGAHVALFGAGSLIVSEMTTMDLQFQNATALADAATCDLLWSPVYGLLAACQDALYRASDSLDAVEQVCPVPGLTRVRDWPGAEGGLLLVVDGDCSLQLLPADLDCGGLACYNGDFADNVTDAFPVSDGSAVLATAQAASAVLLVGEDSADVAFEGFPLNGPVAMAPGGDYWGSDFLVLNSVVWPSDAFERLYISGVDVDTSTGVANASVFIATTQLRSCVSMSLNAVSKDVVFFGNYAADSISFAVQCVLSVADDDDGPTGGGGGGGSDWVLAVLLSTGAIAALGGTAAAVVRRRRRRVDNPETQLPLLGDLVTPESDLMIDESRLERGEPIGGGTFGTVFKGTYAGAPVAIKRMQLRIGDDDWTSRVRAETLALARLRHPHVLRTYGIVVDEEGYEAFLVTELCATSLQAVIADGDFDRLRVARQLADAFVYLHSCGVVHRDLKPDNVLLDARGDVRVADFGECRDIDNDGTFAATAMTGTVGYMAPELISRRAAAELAAYHGGACDVYSFGVVLNSLATRQRPFCHLKSHMAIAIINATEAGERPLLSEAASPEFNALVEACWAQDPRERPRFGEVMERLGGLSGVAVGDR